MCNPSFVFWPCDGVSKFARAERLPVRTTPRHAHQPSRSIFVRITHAGSSRVSLGKTSVSRTSFLNAMASAMRIALAPSPKNET